MTLPDRVAITSVASLPLALQQVGAAAARLNFGMVERTKLVTATSELCRNILNHAGHGMMEIDIIMAPPRDGIRITVSDQGPGIADISVAMQDGYSSGRGSGLGLPGSRRLMHEFSIDSAPGRGTRVVIILWKR